ncbi:MAG: HIT family protein, partial [Ilumatobacteraceae bacterium]
MSTIFSRIIAGEIPGTFVYRDERCVAFMSINPLARGHALVVPVAEIDHWIDAPPDLVQHLFAVVHRIGLAQKQAFACERVGV